MLCRAQTLVPLAIVAAVVSGGAEVGADLIKLHNGGEIRGRIDVAVGAATADEVTIETLTGGVVVVDQENIQFVTRRPLVYEQYEVRAKQTPETVEAQWDLAEWCRERRLTSQRETHLEIILRLDPEHEKAHYGLGHTQRDGKWMSRDEAMEAEGLVKYKGRYITPQELELIKKTELELAAEREWYRKVRLWHTWLTGRDPDRSQSGYLKLRKITDPHAVPALMDFLGENKNVQVRTILVEILSKLPGDKPVPPLADICLNDSNYELRYMALNGISPDQYGAAVPIFVDALKSDSNQVVRRAGAALERIGDERIVPDLIAALVTTHRYRVRVPAHPTVSVTSDGSFGKPGVSLPPELEARLRTGQVSLNNRVSRQFPQSGVPTKIVTVNHNHKNSEVLAALTKQTGQDFGYDERTWRLWLLAQKNNPAKEPALP